MKMRLEHSSGRCHIAATADGLAQDNYIWTCVVHVPHLQAYNFCFMILVSCPSVYHHFMLTNSIACKVHHNTRPYPEPPALI